MKYRIKPSLCFRQQIQLPASKSISNRALTIHALTGGILMPANLSDCDDTNVIVRALSNMPEVIDIGAAGTAMRFLTAYLCTIEGEHVLTGSERMKQRPIGVLVEAMRRLGADIEYVEEEGFPPLHIRGKKLAGGYLEIPGNISSQFISALLMIGASLTHGLTLKLTGGIISRPYIDLTLDVMRHYGASADWDDSETIVVKAQPYQDCHFYIENDWSAASYWYEILALAKNDGNEVTLPGLFDGSPQGDSVIRFLFSMLGVKTAFNGNEATLSCHIRNVQRMDFDFVNTPDLAQTLVVTCCALGIKFHFKGLSTLKIKETDRILALKTELHKLGYEVKDANDSELIWEGERCEPEHDQTINTYNDHRMAMAFAPLALTLGEITIDNPEVVSKSYPNYWEDLRKIGFEIEEIQTPT